MSKPVILIIGAEDIFQTVAKAGFTTTDKIEDVPVNRAIIIDLRNVDISEAQILLEELRNIKSQKHLQIYGWTEPNASLNQYEIFKFDGLLNEETPLSYIKARLESASRIAAMSREAMTRFNTLAQFGAQPKPSYNLHQIPPKILIYGAPGPDNMRITAILDHLEILCVAAFSSFSAFEYLHNGGFDAVIVFANDDKTGALSFCSALRRNSRLFHIPCLLLVNSDFGNFEDAILKGATDVDFIGVSEENSIIRLMTHIDEKRRRDALKMAFRLAKSDKAIDRASGLYNFAFFKSHLNALIKEALNFKDQVCIIEITIHVTPQHNPNLEIPDDRRLSVINQVGSMIARLVRTEDTAARIALNRFAIILPFSDKITAFNAGQRICAVLESSAFDIGSSDEAAMAEAKFEISEITDKNNLETVMLKFAS